MEERPYTQFYAVMLGGFSLCFNGECLQLDVKLQNKMMQILLALIKAGSKGMTRDALMQVIWHKGEEKQKGLSNLNQQIYLLRKQIRSFAFPPGRYIVQRKLVYYFTLDYDVKTDIGYLDELLLAIRTGTRTEDEECELLRKFCQSYTGEFLPMLNGEEWVTEENAYYQTQYFNCLSRLCEILKKRGAYEEMLEFCTAASQIHPYDEWQAVQIECLMSLKRYKEAAKVYEKAAEIFYEDAGLTSLDRVMAKYQSISGQICYMSNVLTEIKEGLREHEPEMGGYCCSYPSFVDIYRVIVRSGERLQQQSLLMICTLKAGEIYDTKTCINLDFQMELFCRFLARNIRSGDVYTQYSPNQILVLFTRVEDGSETRILSRLKKLWEKERGDKNAEIEFVIQKAEGPGAEECGNEKKRNLCSTDYRLGKFYLAGSDHVAG